MEINKLEGETRDLASDNIEALKHVFPEAVTDGKVDVERLKELLGEEAEESEERYSFTWPGKRDAIQLAISRNTGTLRPDKESSKDWDTTKNLFIEGDNLEVLRVLQNTYRGKVKMIYIDPPYNTGKDFVYKDDFKDNVANYKEQAGLVGQSNPDTSGRYHTNWLNMMYPRLRLSKNLLTNDGVIFISIDDNEVPNLRKICDEIFGEQNFVAQIAWRRTDNQPNIGLLARVKEYILCYARSAPDLVLGRTALSDRAKKEYRYEDVKGKFRRANLCDKTRGRYAFDVATPSGKVISGPWMLSEEDFIELQEAGGVYWATGDDELPYGKIYLHESEGQIPNDFLGIEFGTNQQAGLELEKLFGGVRYFDFPKPVSLIRHLITIGSKESELVLDFFAGAGTTAEAVITQNVEDGGNRRFIMVQLPEISPEDSAARKAGYKTIAEISRERIRRAGEKVRIDCAEKLSEREVTLDMGFKAFTLDTTNFREWDSNTEDINASLLSALDTFKEGRNAEDALYEVLLKYGVDITEPVEVLYLAGKTVYSLADNYLLVCLEKEITLETTEEMAKLKPARVVCYDDGFESDEVKQNALETLNRAGVEDVRVI